MQNQNNKNEKKEFRTREELNKYLIDEMNKQIPKYFHGVNTRDNLFDNLFKVKSEPIYINLLDLLNMIDDEFVKSLKKENPQTEQEKTITKDEDENEEFSNNINRKVRIINGKYANCTGIITGYNCENTYELDIPVTKKTYEISLINKNLVGENKCIVPIGYVVFLEDKPKYYDETKDQYEKLSINLANKLKQGCYSINDILNIYNANTTKEQCKKECYEALAKSSQSNNDNINKQEDETLTEKELNELADRLMKEYFNSFKNAKVIKIDKNDSKETIKEKLNSVKSDNMEFNEDTGEITLKSNPTKTLKQIDDEMQSNVGKQGKIINHTHLKDGCIVDILDFSRDLGKYIIKADDFLTTHASYEQVEIVEDKVKKVMEFENIIIEGYDELINNYEIIITQDDANAKIWDEDSWSGENEFEFNLEDELDENILRDIREGYDNPICMIPNETFEKYLIKKLRCLYLNKEREKFEKKYEEMIKQYDKLDDDYNNEVVSLVKLEEEMMS